VAVEILLDWGGTDCSEHKSFNFYEGTNAFLAIEKGGGVICEGFLVIMIFFNLWENVLDYGIKILFNNVGKGFYTLYHIF
jgi:hypothetical protein